MCFRAAHQFQPAHVVLDTISAMDTSKCFTFSKSTILQGLQINIYALATAEIEDVAPRPVGQERMIKVKWSKNWSRLGVGGQ